jgi:hypothetical protein
MKKLLAIMLLVAPLAVLAETNTLEQARAAYIEARRIYMEARMAAGLTNAVRQTSASGTIFTKSQKKFFENRRICISRDTTTIPGSVITTWYRNGKPDTQGPAVVTNVLHRITGTIQDNPLQSRIAALIERATSAEARAARLNRLKDWLAEQRDKALLPTTKAIYQAILDRMEDNQ